eukprot:CAMPEP_0175051248 /NCGR_PEP_ID=MMETSP0052_2-20121109/7688_1 /TAXON_ID=51329 ORGANISM="Polytomella parva, Strain SAG 63-3" /NCGR_SAMPLE_ID=MMETSP0052_2 /ASSEMBLY_ACC=CAM_ASM_000194 /LENGTH=207 /DNA_ID=CAMNT_0016315499 /DNA_START=983 /DNA_END=1606 /DNA_ORIENTATION=-
MGTEGVGPNLAPDCQRLSVNIDHLRCFAASLALLFRRPFAFVFVLLFILIPLSILILLLPLVPLTFLVLFVAGPSPLAINNALIASAGNRSRKADYVIVAEETAVKNAAGAIAKVLDRLSMDATANGLQAISSCPVFAERKSKNIAAAISVAVKAIAVARDYIANEGHNHEVAFQPYFRDLSTISASSASSASSVSPFRFAPFALRS